MMKESSIRQTSLHRALDILSALAESERPLTATEINQKLQLPKATVHRLCAALEANLFLQKELDGTRLLPGRQLRRLALGVIANEHFQLERHTILNKLTGDIGETCNISIPDGSEMRYIDRSESSWPLRLQLPVGTRVPLHCTSSGKLYLSHLSETRCDRLIRKLPLEECTSNTFSTVESLKSELARIRKEQVGTDNEEFLEGMVCVAVPILDHRERLCATLSFHAPSSRMNLDQALSHVSLLRKASFDLEELMENQ